MSDWWTSISSFCKLSELTSAHYVDSSSTRFLKPTRGSLLVILTTVRAISSSPPPQFISSDTRMWRLWWRSFSWISLLCSEFDSHWVLNACDILPVYVKLCKCQNILEYICLIVTMYLCVCVCVCIYISMLAYIYMRICLGSSDTSHSFMCKCCLSI